MEYSKRSTEKSTQLWHLRSKEDKTAEQKDRVKTGSPTVRRRTRYQERQPVRMHFSERDLNTVPSHQDL